LGERQVLIILKISKEKLLIISASECNF